MNYDAIWEKLRAWDGMYGTKLNLKDKEIRWIIRLLQGEIERRQRERATAKYLKGISPCDA